MTAMSKMFEKSIQGPSDAYSERSRRANNFEWPCIERVQTFKFMCNNDLNSTIVNTSKLPTMSK